MHDFEEENISMGPLFMTVGVGTFFVIAVIFALTGLNETLQQDMVDQWASVKTPDTAAYEAEQAENLARYAVIDQDKGKVQIPVERAMELVIQERTSD
jgi:hypothetical protein